MGQLVAHTLLELWWLRSPTLGEGIPGDLEGGAWEEEGPLNILMNGLSFQLYPTRLQEDKRLVSCSVWWAGGIEYKVQQACRSYHPKVHEALPCLNELSFAILLYLRECICSFQYTGSIQGNVLSH